METEELKTVLSNFPGTESYHKLSLAPLKCTDGIAWMAEKCGAFWLVDAIGSYQVESPVKGLPFQLWTLEVDTKKNGILRCREDSNTKVLVEQMFTYTDFPLGTWKFYVCDGVLMVPGEY